MTPERKAFLIFHNFYKIGNMSFNDAVKCSKVLIQETLYEVQYWCSEEMTKKEQERIGYWHKVSEELERLTK